MVAIVGGSILLLGLGGGGLLFSTRQTWKGHASPSSSPVSPPLSLNPPSATTEAAPPPIVSATASAAAEPALIVDASAASNTARPDAASVVPPAPQPAPRPTVNCNPPHYYDAKGNRVFKKECL
jgi:hypothetical protein